MSEQNATASRIAPAWGGPLNAADYDSLASSWITRELADQAMLRRVDTDQGREVVGQRGNRDCSGILISYYWPGEPSPFNYRVRRDNPDWTVGKDGKPKPERKYLGPPKSGNRLYIPPGVTLEQLGDVTIPIAIVEGEKKAVALWRLANYEREKPRFIPVAIGGVWSWRGVVERSNGPRGERIDVKGPIPDLSRIEWRERDAFIVFDADVNTNQSVNWARKGIAGELGSRGAEVQFINLLEDSGVNGIDDLLALWGPDRVLEELFKRPEPAPEADRAASQAQLLTQLGSEADLFHTPQGEAYARIVVDRHRETWGLRSKGFRRWLIRRFYQTCSKPPGAQALHDAIGVLEARAQFDSPEAAVSVRVAEYTSRIYIDLCNADWQAVEISSEGWRVVDDPPVRFRRAKGMKPLPQPVTGGSIKLLRNIINVGDDDNWILCASWLVAACRPTGPYPILILQGEHGSAKSTLERIVRRIVDPSVALVRTPPRDDRDLLIGATNSWVLAYDNLSGLPPWLSDSLCRLATGGGFATRELYTDSDEVFFDAMRPVVLNGIDQLTERADLADRSLVLNLPRIKDRDRKDEAQLYADFERDLPQILGALLTAVSAALGRLPGIKLESKPRMADFALWATAAERALGLQDGAFMDAYTGNRADAIQETLEAEPVATAIRALMNTDQTKTDRWEGTCKDLQQDLERFVDESVKKSRAWPRTPRGLSGRLRRLITFLRESGIEITFNPRGAKGERTLTIERTAKDSTASSATIASADPPDSGDQTIRKEEAGGGTSSGMPEEPPTTEQPPPDWTSAIPLNGRANRQRAAEVAEEAVSRESNLGAQFTFDRIDLCAQCGPVNWEWVGRAWICPECREPARGQSPSAKASVAESV
jgi:hypothetical protein